VPGGDTNGPGRLKKFQEARVSCPLLSAPMLIMLTLWMELQTNTSLFMMMIPILIQFCSYQRRSPDVSYIFVLDTFSPFCSITCILSFQISLLNFFLDLFFSCISWSSSSKGVGRKFSRGGGEQRKKDRKLATNTEK